MRILLLGARGFLGGRIAARLREAGHTVLDFGRRDADLSRAQPSTWAEHLSGVDAVVNAAGILRGDLDGIHHRGPATLFDACAVAGIARLVQISALGAAPDAPTAFLRTKGRADAHLLRLRREAGRAGWCVLRPALVVGRGGASTGLFAALAALPWPARLGGGPWQVQPLHVEDLAAAVLSLLEHPLPVPDGLDLVGPEAMSTDALTLALRDWLRLPARRFVAVPGAVLRLAASMGAILPASPLTPDTLAMLRNGSTGDPRPAMERIGWQARPLAQALAMEPATPADRWHARLLPLRPALRGALAVVWIGSGVVPLLFTPPAFNAALLAGLGLHGMSGQAVLLAGALLDIAVGLAFLRPRHTGLAGALAIAMTLAFTLLASIAAPEMWAHPFAPLLKNLAMIMATLALLAMRD
ncbi:SDR family oxidoreductase [Roseomonas sp. GC11]|uniref:SDR family oxidoreductase n=1 Tax=Roseomonas sp. GC11 TaxID=2950546 RepID=UPI00210F206E|nr:SDR family oxidoreductase [Roseomonas sp. GC11]MCQ4160543.1 SDR family oxidoreductase [Roseomonas sp. GC11]